MSHEHALIAFSKFAGIYTAAPFLHARIGLAYPATMTRVLLLQIRDEPRVRAEELASFIRHSGLSPGQIDVLNVFDESHFDHRVLDGYDSLFVGGASEASVMEPERYPFVPPACELLSYCVEQSIPVFASCFGFQLAVVALGGKLVRDADNFEMGTVPMSLTSAAAQDPLFRDVPDGFFAVSVHRERAARLPFNVELLAYTAACPHAFRVSGKPFWAFQFHPELDRDTLAERLTIFGEKYTDGDGQLKRVIKSIVETPESNELVKNFVQRVLNADRNLTGASG